MMCIHVFHIVPAVIGIHSRADCLYQFYTSSALFLGARPPWGFQLEAPGSQRSQGTGPISPSHNSSFHSSMEIHAGLFSKEVHASISIVILKINK